MSFQTTEKPDEQDLKNYSFDREAFQASPFYASPGTFLKLGQRVRAKFRIWDCPGKTLEDNWGWVSADTGETGTVVHQQDGHWPTVRFDETGCSTCVTHMEVEPLNVETQRRAYSEFFDGLSYRLRNWTPATCGNSISTKDGFSEAFVAGVNVAEDYLKNIESGKVEGVSLNDLIATVLRGLKY